MYITALNAHLAVGDAFIPFGIMAVIFFALLFTSYISFHKKLYLEFAGKLDYAYYYNLDVYKGNAKQGFGTMEFILSLGYTLPMGPKLNSAK